MGLGNSIKYKLFFILVIMGAIPFIIVICLSSVNMVRDWEVSVKKSGDLRNKIISEHVTELFEKNFYVLHATAVNSSIVNYVKNPQPEKQKEILFLLHATNEIFRDKNLMALTASNGEQLIRTDGSKLVNIGNRRHFHESMNGKDFVSNVIVSMSTGKMIVVLTTPIKDEKNNVVGILQRNFDIGALQDFVETQDDEENSVIILDRNGRVIVDSEQKDNVTESFLDNENYKFISELDLKNSDTVRVNVNGYDALVSYSQNNLTDWTIISIQPYKFILNQVYEEILKDILIGFAMLLAVAAVAYYTSVRATRPILEITKAANIMASGNLKIEKLHVDSHDELGTMAEAFNKITSARDAYQLEAEVDTLTKLYNKKTFEIACKNKLEEFKNFGAEEKKFMAMYIIDLDHFKEVNDTYGHQFGDKVLEEFAARLKKSFRPYDYVARFGGDEFLVFLADLPDTEIIFRKAEWINKIAREINIDNENAKISASIGISVIPNDGLDYEEIFTSADKSLYFVKNNGRDGYFCQSLNIKEGTN